MGRAPGEEQAKWAAAISLLDEAKADLLHTIEEAEAAPSKTDESPAGRRKDNGNDTG